MSPSRFAQRIAIITAAGNGIGRATAELMARDGATVIAVDINSNDLDGTCKAIRASGGDVRARPANVLDAIAVDALVAEVVREFGRVDILVNCVGGSTGIPRPAATVDELTLDDWRSLISLNLEGTFLFCRVVAPVMKQHHWGKIVNVGSVAARGTVDRASAAYAAAKGALLSFTVKLAHELGPHGINVNAIVPGVTLSERIGARWAERSDLERAESIARIPLRRMAEPLDQARVICFLASEEAAFVTGVAIDVTGGA